MTLELTDVFILQAEGSQALVGPQGPQGIPGPQGPQGPPGPPGNGNDISSDIRDYLQSKSKYLLHQFREIHTYHFIYRHICSADFPKVFPSEAHQAPVVHLDLQAHLDKSMDWFLMHSKGTQNKQNKENTPGLSSKV